MRRRSNNGKPGARCRGSALPAVLVLLAVMLQLTVAANRAGIDGTRATTSLSHAAQAFALAERHLQLGLRLAQTDPTALPVGASIALPGISDPHGSSRATLTHAGSGNACNELQPLMGERHDYEIRATATTPRAGSHQRQGFFICRELCAAPCVALESAPVPTHWVVTRENL